MFNLKQFTKEIEGEVKMGLKEVRTLAGLNDNAICFSLKSSFFFALRNLIA